MSLETETSAHFDSFKTKPSVVIVYTGASKGKTSAGLGLLARNLGTGGRVAFVQFIKHWPVGEHAFIEKIMRVFPNQLTFFKGGKGFYNVGDFSAKNVSKAEHTQAAQETFDFALQCATSGDYDVVICDEINNAVHDGLLTVQDLEKLIDARSKKTSLCFTGRNFPPELFDKVDIATNMSKIKHHFDEQYIANKGIDY